MSSDQIDAAIITPAAKPKSSFSTHAGIFLRIKNTIAEPSVVPMNGMISPQKTSILISYDKFFLSNDVFQQTVEVDYTVRLWGIAEDNHH